jgi:tRNA U54 and U55 pseudouridine synthase Pus10
MAPKLLAAAELENKETLELETPRQCYVCKTDFTKMHHFYDTMCTDVVILIMQNVFKLLM